MRAHLVKNDAVAGQTVDIVEVRVGIEERVPLLHERAAAPLVGAGLGHEFDLDGAFAQALRA